MTPAQAALIGFVLGAAFASAVAALLWWRYSRPHREPYELSEWGWVATVRDQAQVRWLRGERDGVAALHAGLRLVMRGARRA